MASIHEQREEFNKYRAMLLNLSRSLSKISSIEDLMDARKEYLDCTFDLKEFFEKENMDQRATSLFLNDEVVNHHMKGGAGISLADERAQSLISVLEKEIPRKIERLDQLYEIFDVHHVIEKRDSVFFYIGEQIILEENSHPWHLLDILYTCGDDEGFVSYTNIFKELARRRKDGLLTLRDKITENILKNARRELFTRERLRRSSGSLPNKTPSGVKLIHGTRKRNRRGLKLNNERIS